MEDLPKTRSAKIMCRILKDIAAERAVQRALSTLEDPATLQSIIEDFNE